MQGWLAQFSKYTLAGDDNFVFDESDESGSSESVVAGENLRLATIFAPSAIKYRVHSWSGGLNGDDASLSEKLSAEMPLSSSPVLTGLAGVGLPGRYKARWREPA